MNGSMLVASFSLVGETTRFQYFGPLTGNTFKLSISQALPIASSFLQNTTVETDLRQYIHIGADFLLAFRLEGFASRGKNPFIFYFGGNNQIRSTYYYSIIGNEGWFFNAEFRFPLINAASSVIGQLGPVRGTFFFDIGRAKIKGYPAKIQRFTNDPINPWIFFDAVGSYGFGFEFFLIGLPIHIDFVKRLEFPDINKPHKYNIIGDFDTKFWIGFDF